ncbi:unnamed protein product, partial [Ectocarpus sp. 12 AP-2014]
GGRRRGRLRVFLVLFAAPSTTGTGFFQHRSIDCAVFRDSDGIASVCWLRRRRWFFPSSQDVHGRGVPPLFQTPRSVRHDLGSTGGDPQHHRVASGHHAVRRPLCRRRGARSGERNGGGGRRRHVRLGRSGFQDGGKSGPVPLVRQRPQDPPDAVTGGAPSAIGTEIAARQSNYD